MRLDGKPKAHQTPHGFMILYRDSVDNYPTYHPTDSCPEIPIGGWIEIEQEDGSWRRYEYSQ